MAKDAIGAHARDELNITHITTARPVQAAVTSAATFTTGASLPLLAAWLLPFGPPMIGVVAASSLLFLAMLGAIGAKAGGAPVGKATLRVAFWAPSHGDHCGHRETRRNRSLAAATSTFWCPLSTPCGRQPLRWARVARPQGCLVRRSIDVS